MNHLEKILTGQLSRLENLKSIYPIEFLKEKIKSYNNFIDFREKLKVEKNKVSVIAEIKKSSPSAGTIIKNYKPAEIAENYFNNGSSCLSILTEEKFFQGKLEHIYEVKKNVKLPVLMKDFFIENYLVYLAKASGADAILIILSAISDSSANQIYEKANDLNLTTIVEVHNAEEAKKAVWACRYPPDGGRSSGPNRAILYGGSDYQAEANKEIACIVMIETAEAIENIDSILSVEGIDAAYIGPSDLAYALEMTPTGDNNNPDHVKTVEAIFDACIRHGVAPGIHTGSVEYTSRWLSHGFQMVNLGTDIQFLRSRASDSLSQVK